MLTLSCKNRLTCAPQEAARRLPRLTRSGGSELQPTCRARAVRAARGGAPPGQRTGGVCQLVRAVRPLAGATPTESSDYLARFAFAEYNIWIRPKNVFSLGFRDRRSLGKKFDASVTILRLFKDPLHAQQRHARPLRLGLLEWRNCL